MRRRLGGERRDQSGAAAQPLNEGLYRSAVRLLSPLLRRPSTDRLGPQVQDRDRSLEDRERRPSSQGPMDVLDQ